jgi:hypothetical protein
MLKAPDVPSTPVAETTRPQPYPMRSIVRAIVAFVSGSVATAALTGAVSAVTAAGV